MKQLIALTAVVATFGLSACSSDVTADDIRDRYIDAGMSEETATCLAEELEENLSDDDFQTFAKSDDIDDLSSAAPELIADAIVDCTTGS